MARFPLKFPFNFTDPPELPVVSPLPNFRPNILYNLVPGQYQLGNKVIGRGTTVRMETCEVKPYDQNNQDYQVSRSDEVRFGQDTLKPSTIELTFDVIQNKLRPGYEELIPNFWAEQAKVTDFSAMWRNDQQRLLPGSMVPLYICGKDGLTRAVYGRPGQFTYTKEETYDEFVQCLAEFRRADTLSYTADEDYIELALSDLPVYLLRGDGDGPDAWMRIVMSGPLTNPVITIGDVQLKLNYTIEEGNVVEISSYPWQRRAVDANGLNLSQYLSGTQYLDKLVIPYVIPTALKWTSDEANTFVPALGDQKWDQNIDGYSMFAPPPGFTNIHGKTIVRFDLFNFSLDQPFTWTPRKYLGPGVFETKCASIYTAQTFNTPNQRAETQLVNEGLWLGQSVLSIMTNLTMTQLVGVMCDVELGSHQLKIVSGSYDSLTVRDTWDNPASGGFTEYDRIGIEFDPDTKTYSMLFSDGSSDSWTVVGTWYDPDVIIPTGTDNRHQGYVFDSGGGLGILQGPGFTNTIAYDTLQEAAQTGQVFILWRDTWSTIG